MSTVLTHSARRPRTPFLTMALLTALGGCGGSDSDPAPAPAPVQPTQPAISAQPSDQTAAPGGSATFTVSGSGGALGYQWTRNGVAIDGATGATYTTPAVTAQDNAAVYRVNIKNSVGTLWSEKALLAVSGAGVLPHLGAPGLPPASVAAPGTASNPNDSVALRGQEVTEGGRAGLAVDRAGMLYSAWNTQISKVERSALTPWADTVSLGGLGRYPEILGLAAGGKGSLYALARYNHSIATPRPLRFNSAQQIVPIDVADRPSAGGPVQWSGVAADGANDGYFLGSQPVRVCTGADGTVCASEPQVVLMRAPDGAAGASLHYTPDANLYSILTGATSALRFTQPGGIAVGADGSVYVADRGNHVILRISQSGQASLVAGAPGQAGIQDGERAGARLNAPASLAIDGAGNLYVADSGNYTIRRISPAGAVTTLAGVAGNDSLVHGALPGRLPAISHLAVAPDGTVYAAVSGGVVKVAQR